MDTSNRDFMEQLLHAVASIDYIEPNDLPNIDLYMDQITTFMDSQLQSTKRYPADKLLTKTMINNYSKNNLLPASDKKRYSKEHLILLIFIYYFKSFLSIQDIKTLLEPLTKKYFHSKETLNLDDIYAEICQLEHNQVHSMQKELLRHWTKASSTFQDIESEEKTELQKFAFICLLSFDVYVKKMIIEQMIDEMNSSDHD